MAPNRAPGLVSGSTSRGLRIAYFGLPLGALLLAQDGHHLTFCALSPVAGPGVRRLRRTCPTVLDPLALGERFSEEVERGLSREKPDWIVSWFWTRRLPPSWLSSAHRGALGVHPSLLPRHRGPNPYFWAIDSGDVESGVTVHLLEAEYDRGAILEQRRLVIGERNSWQLARALDRPSLRALRDVLSDEARGAPRSPRRQDEGSATPAPEPRGDALRADFAWPTQRLLRRIRALSPVPGLALSLADEDFFVTRASKTESYARALLPGEAQIVGGRLVLRTGDGAIAVDQVALPTQTDDEESVSLSGPAIAQFFTERLGSRSSLDVRSIES